VVLLRVTLDGLLKDHAVTSRYPVTTRSDFAGVRSYTILLDSTSAKSTETVEVSIPVVR
jgi:hypothetical protein